MSIIQINDKKILASIKKRLNPLIRNTNSIFPAQKKMAMYLESQWQLAFKEEGREEKWPKRGVTNIFGIINDLSGGGFIKERRFNNLATLIDTGRLKNSGSTRIEGNTIYWGTNVPYYGAHHFGDTVYIKNTLLDMIKNGNKRVIKELKRVKDRGFENDYGKLITQPAFSLKLPERKAAEVLEKDITAYQEYLKNQIFSEEKW